MRTGVPITPEQIRPGMRISTVSKVRDLSDTTAVKTVKRWPEVMCRNGAHVNNEECWGSHAYVY